MWPSIPSFAPFGDVACPAGTKCDIPCCIFSHEAVAKSKAPTVKPSAASTSDERPSKRLKLQYETRQPVVQGNTPALETPPAFVDDALEAPRTLSLSQTNKADKQTQISDKALVSKPSVKHGLPRSATRPVSPPLKTQAPKTAAKEESKPDTPVTLYPRKLTKEPVAFTKRWNLLKMMRQYMGEWNDKVSQSTSADTKSLALTSNQLNKLANDEEESIGLQHKTVYENIIKRRLLALKKMSLADWVKERRAMISTKEEVKQEQFEKPEAKPVETGLSEKEEVQLLYQMICSQNGLDAHGYVTKQPTEQELEDTRIALNIANHWEQCDRCGTRFQVFPDRREEDGALTTGGECRHHWGKKVYPKRTKGQPEQSTTYGCCGQPIGSEPCSTADSHVFKVNDTKRLSTIMPFIKTPPNDNVDPDTAVCFDCEMGYTTMGMELLRITAISWPSHKPLLDVLVRPIGQLLDVNTRFSGVTTDQFFNAKRYNPNDPATDSKDIHIVDSISTARDLFLSHVAPTTPIIGHALENDLNHIRLIHPNIVDTVLLYPHPGKLPIRHGLRSLAARFLNLKIQQAGAAGHDSLEDARATGELVRYKVAESWRKMKAEGWTFREDGLYPPVPGEAAPSLPQHDLPKHIVTGKRKIDQVDEA